MAQVPTPPAWEVAWPFAGTPAETVHADTAAVELFRILFGPRG